MNPILNSKFLKQPIVSKQPHCSGCRLSGPVQNSSQRGALLLELLVAVSILAAVLAVASQSVYVSMLSGKISGESDVAIGLANEALEATRAIADERWQNIYDLSKGAQYHPVQSGTKWATSTASEQIALNTANYTRYFVVENVCRDDTTREITGVEPCALGSNDDPSSQKVTITVSWQGSGSPAMVSDYLLRWRNKITNQTDWSGGVGGGATNYGSIEPADTIDTTGGSLKLQ